MINQLNEYLEEQRNELLPIAVGLDTHREPTLENLAVVLSIADNVGLGFANTMVEMVLAEYMVHYGTNYRGLCELNSSALYSLDSLCSLVEHGRKVSNNYDEAVQAEIEYVAALAPFEEYYNTNYKGLLNLL